MDNISERLKIIIDTFFKSRNSELAKKTGIENSALSRWLSGESEPTIQKLSVLELAGINADWVLTGHGSFYANNEQGDSLKSNYRHTLTSIIQLAGSEKDDLKAIQPFIKLLPQVNHEKFGVPYYDIDVTGSALETFSDITEEPEFYIDFKPFNDCVAYFPIYGDSMFPAYKSGEIVAIKQMVNFDVLLWGETYLIITSPEANNLKTIKQLFPHKDKDKVVLKASNPNFNGETVVKKAHIRAIYIIKGKISKNMP